MVFDIARIVHIGLGMVALVVAPGAMLTKKGGTWHRRWGQVYFWSMAAVAVTAVIMAVETLNLFLLMLAVFSFYLAFSGYRILYRKRPDAPASPIDWFGTGLTLVASLVLIGVGIWAMLTGKGGTASIPLVFGVIGALMAGGDIREYRTIADDKRHWWYGHMQRMLGAYIATVSAFSAVNFTFLPEVIRWLWPTVIGTIGISIWITYYKNKFAQRSHAAGD